MNKNKVKFNDQSQSRVSIAASTEEKLQFEKIIKLTPKEIYTILEDSIIGQEEAKRTLSIALNDHIKRSFCSESLSDSIPSNNVFIIGPSGSGKTELVRTLSRKIGLPFVDYDATRLSKAGYEGESIRAPFQSLIYKSSGNVKLAEKAIVFIDELDKTSSMYDEKGVGTIQVQNSLLKVLEGTDVKVTYKKETLYINTRNILFVAGGAFNNQNAFEKTSKSALGLNKTKSQGVEIEKHELSGLLISLGMDNQLIGRFSSITRTHNLSREERIEYLENGNQTIIHKTKVKMLLNGITRLDFTKEFINMIVDKSMDLQTGVRGIHSLVTQHTADILFHTKTNTSKVTLLKEGFVIGTSKKLIKY